ncbi:MAG TPA: hypothetical protein VGD50_01910, partial [Candidatus Baltobacteraceae bacterium]
AHARAGAFGVNSVLALPFSAAVKTGTSSDYRDTWTVGFTRDYTVGVWVGNFDGSPMRGISGVTGAGPLWNRIMLHLHEQREPLPFDPPRGYRRRPICANTGTKPDAHCAVVVSEYLDARDLKTYDRAAGGAVGAPATAAREPNILFPRDGDRFVWYPRGGSAQRLQFVFAAQNATPQVTLNGHLLGPREGDYLWPVALGHYTLRVQTAQGVTAAHFAVILPPPRRMGFSRLGS